MNDVILFQGDSITDAGRAKDNANPNDFAALGNGYAAMLSYALLGAHAGHKLAVLQPRDQRPQGPGSGRALADGHHRPETRAPEHPHRRE
jgi:hypothetical protein